MLRTRTIVSSLLLGGGEHESENRARTSASSTSAATNDRQEHLLLSLYAEEYQFKITDPEALHNQKRQQRIYFPRRMLLVVCHWKLAM